MPEYLPPGVYMDEVNSTPKTIEGVSSRQLPAARRQTAASHNRTTMAQDDIDNGRRICEVGVAPVRPLEFVIFRIHLTTQRAF
jgi:phage tail sheath protein FI